MLRPLLFIESVKARFKSAIAPGIKQRMQHDIPIGTATQTQRATKNSDLMSAFLLALLALLPAIVNGSVVDWPHDNDSMMRIVQVRDLLAGQNWYDYTQYRMGPDGGFVMHWSRTADLPLAAIITVTATLTGSVDTGEFAAGVIWPLLLFGLSIFAILRSARILGGDQAVFPAAVIGTMSLYSIGIFAPGVFDHHNLQLTLCLLALWAILDGTTLWRGFAAGAALAATMATGMETLPLVAAACSAVALDFLIRGQRQAHQTIGLGTGFASVSTFLFAATIGPENWPEIHCDAFSGAHLSVAVIGGAGLATAAALPVANRTVLARSITLAGLGVVLAILVASAYPQCLADPYAGLDERLRSLWLSSVGEAQSASSVWAKDPVLFAKYYATPLAALFVLVAAGLGDTPKRAPLLVLWFLFIAIVVSFWQVRGANFALALAAVPLAVWVGEKRKNAVVNNRTKTTLAMIFAWVISLNASWTFAAQTLQNAANPSAIANADTSTPHDPAESCYGAESLAMLAAVKAGTVVAVSNLGPTILRFTHHRVLAGPYHRNVAGNTATLDIFMRDPDQARQVLVDHDVDLIAHCPSEEESGVLAGVAPHGLLAALIHAEPPEWLSAIDRTDTMPLILYRVER